MTKLTILGSGTGVPNGRRNSVGYFMESGPVRLLMDCGAGTVHALSRLGLPWQSITHVFFSHFHVDHAGELPALMHALKWGVSAKRELPLTILGSGSLERVIGGLTQAFGPKLFQPGFDVNIRMLGSGETVALGPECSLSVAKTPHTEDSLGARIRASGRVVCYTGDTAFSNDLADFFAGADLMIAECSYLENKPGVNHLSVDEVAKMAARAHASTLAVTHFYFEPDDVQLKAELSRYYSGEVIIGADGMTFEL
jgi:ribonuclease BN (tRNA processing enzyme)